MSIDINWHGYETPISLDELVRRVDDEVAGGVVAVALTDLDRFAELNERHGRGAGLKALQVWVETLVNSLPHGAIVGRLGGDEFGLALPNVSLETALIFLNEIVIHLREHLIEDVRISATFGLAARPPHAIDTRDLFRCANEALSRGKREGGGRVAIFVEERMVLKSNYYSRGSLDRLSRLAGRLNRTEASLLREALDDLFNKLR